MRAIQGTDSLDGVCNELAGRLEDVMREGGGNVDHLAKNDWRLQGSWNKGHLAKEQPRGWVLEWKKKTIQVTES
jgi:hypothetical protein